jgi:Protein of unknown function (DUF1553)/Protein of unknown function (DUF1549)/Planctomycete cytochrome C
MALVELLVIALPLAGQQSGPPKAETVQFNRDIRPILSDRCFVCHGPDRSSEQAEMTSLRLDDRDMAIQEGIFDFENVASSEILRRVISADPDVQMPPPKSQKPQLTSAEVALIKRWIDQGAPYQQHWAYLPPKRPVVPNLKRVDCVHNPIDAFVVARLEKEGIEPAAIADRETLIRRASFDLTGLPPTVSQIDEFLADPAATAVAFEKVIDRLLAAPAYGDHQTRYWLDAARYADTSGYQYDMDREQWVWRDWVIAAFNNNMPFDQFTIQQIAGDLLPNASDQTHLATAFNRNHPITIEGGVIDEEYRTEYVIDRVVTTGAVWLGQTFTCSRCHDHKYDPITQQDFYSFFAFFNNVPERGLNGFDPKRTVASPLAAARLRELTEQRDRAQATFDGLKLPLEQWELDYKQMQPTWEFPKPTGIVSSGGATFAVLADGSVLMGGVNPSKDDYEIVLASSQDAVKTIRLEAIVDPSLTNGSASRGSNGNFVLTEFMVEAATPDSPQKFAPVKISDAQADYEQNGFGVKLAIDGETETSAGWAVDGNSRVENRAAHFQLQAPIPAGSLIRIRLLHRYGLSHQIGRFRLATSSQAANINLADWIAIEPSQRSQQQRRAVIKTLLDSFADAGSQRAHQELVATEERLAQAGNFPATMVMSEMSKPRDTFVLDRGEYDKPRLDKAVSADVPLVLGSLNEKYPKNRLGLAQWLVSTEQPLTARVTVNRFWQQIFGTGLVKTTEDFGSQGEFPSHPELLDWLATEFQQSGWNIKSLFKTILMSRTYQQASAISADSFARDPENRLLARSSRFRLDAEVIRDNALAVSGLLDQTQGGPSVYPYHPEGLWLEINNRPGYSKPYPHQTDPKQLHRRSVYSFWKRTVTPPTVAMFDAPSREYCVMRRSRTNTPLQAFVMLNDPQFVEAAQHLASRMEKEAGASVDEKIRYGFRLCTARLPSEQELSILRKAYITHLAKYQSDSTAIERLFSVGHTPIDSKLDRNKIAALAVVARMLLNLSEFITKG